VVMVTGSLRGSHFEIVRFFDTGKPWPDFRPIKGLDSPDVVPFLIDVLEKGPDWTDEKLLKARGGIYPHIARCYAAMCLGVIGDRRAYPPLIDALLNGDFLEDKYVITNKFKQDYHISDYAALALGYLGDPNAVGPLIKALQNDRRESAVYGLTMLRDIRAIEPIITCSSELDRFDTRLRIHRCLEYITGTHIEVEYSRKAQKFTVPDFPDIGELDYNQSFKVIWQHWFKHREAYAKQQFEKFYPKWKSLQKNRPDDKASQRLVMYNMVRGGVSTLTLLMDAVDKGDESLIPVVSRLTHIEKRRFGTKVLVIDPKSTRTECLAWWKNNKDKWEILDPNDER